MNKVKVEKQREPLDIIKVNIQNKFFFVEIKAISKVSH